VQLEKSAALPHCSERKCRGKDIKILNHVSLILCIHIFSLFLDGFVTMAEDGAFIVEG